MGAKERYYKVINDVWNFIKNHIDVEQDWEQFCSDMKDLVMNANVEDQKMLRAMLVAFENDLVDRSESNG